MLKLQLLEDPNFYVKLTSLPVTLGRDESNDLVLDASRVSDFHAEIDENDGGLFIVDLLSSGGTFVNEHRVVDRYKLKPWDLIRVGTVELEINDPNTCRPDSWALRTESDLLSSQFYTLKDKTIVGRDPECDLTIDWYLLSRRHAELTIEDDHLLIKDLDSRNGTYLNGEKVEEGTAFPGDELRFDEQRFVVVGPSGREVEEESDDEQTLLREEDPDLTQIAENIDPDATIVNPGVVDPDQTRVMTSPDEGAETQLPDEETILYQNPALNNRENTPDTSAGGDNKSVPVWLPGALAFVLAAVLAVALYLWRSGSI